SADARADPDQAVLAPWAIDRRGPDDRDGRRARVDIPERELIGHDLRAGVTAAGCVRIVAVVFRDDRPLRARSVDADGRDVDEPADALGESGLDEPLGPEHVDLEKVDPAARRRDLARAMEDHIHALDGAL